MRKIWLISLIIVSACVPDSLQINHVRTTDFLLIDTCSIPTEYLKEAGSEDFPIYYIGPLTDTIFIGRWYDRRRRANPPRYEGPATYSYGANTLKIEVDTSFQTSISCEYYDENGVINADSIRHYHASVFTIKNISDTTVLMGITYSVYFLHREIKNEKGEWVQMGEDWAHELYCATGQPNIYLKPGEIMLSKVMRYSGTYLTDCRLVFGRNGHRVYSNVFKESVDPKIFSQQFKLQCAYPSLRE